MPGPDIVFAFMIATLWGAGFHLIMGGNARRLTLYLVGGWFGFFIGHILAEISQLRLFRIGELNILTASAVTVFVLIVITVLTAKRTPRRRTRS